MQNTDEMAGNDEQFARMMMGSTHPSLPNMSKRF